MTELESHHQTESSEKVTSVGLAEAASGIDPTLVAASRPEVLQDSAQIVPKLRAKTRRGKTPEEIAAQRAEYIQRKFGENAREFLTEFMQGRKFNMAAKELQINKEDLRGVLRELGVPYGSAGWLSPGSMTPQAFLGSEWLPQMQKWVKAGLTDEQIAQRCRIDGREPTRKTVGRWRRNVGLYKNAHGWTVTRSEPSSAQLETVKSVVEPTVKVVEVAAPISVMPSVPEASIPNFSSNEVPMGIRMSIMIGTAADLIAGQNNLPLEVILGYKKALGKL